VRLKRFKITAFLLFVFGLTSLHAQESVNSSGGNATGSGGLASYSVGQVVYSAQANSTGSMSEGVQQIFEISVLIGYEEVTDTDLSYSVYPNPSNDFLLLKVDGSQAFNIKSMHCKLYDINGKLVGNKNLTGSETSIDMSELLPTTYFLKIIKDNKEVKVFKIIKNQAK